MADDFRDEDTLRSIEEAQQEAVIEKDDSAEKHKTGGEGKPPVLAWKQKSVEHVQRALDDARWHAVHGQASENVDVFFLGFVGKGANFKAQVWLDAAHMRCTMRIVLPLSADERYKGLMMLKLQEISSARRIGKYVYRPTSREISLDYEYLDLHGVDSGEFRIVMETLLHTALEDFTEIRKYACGQFSKEEKLKLSMGLVTQMKELSGE